MQPSSFLLFYLHRLLWGGMRYIVMKMGWAFMILMDVSGSECVVATASPFVGQGESLLLVKPFVEFMTLSELHSAMTSGRRYCWIRLIGIHPLTQRSICVVTACMMSSQPHY
jgi:nucleoside permease NupC